MVLPLSPLTVEQIADSAWLRAASRIAIPFMAFILYGQFSNLQELAQKVPRLEMRIEGLERGQTAASSSANTGRSERLSNQQDVMVELGRVKERILSLDSAIVRIERNLELISALVARKKDAEFEFPSK